MVVVVAVGVVAVHCCRTFTGIDGSCFLFRDPIQQAVLGSLLVHCWWAEEKGAGTDTVTQFSSVL